MNRIVVRPRLVGMWAVAMMVVSGCVADKPSGLVRSSAPAPAKPLRLELGTVAVMSAAKPAMFSFDKAQGQIEDASDGAGDELGRVLIPPALPDPLLEVAASPLAFAAAPFAAVQGAVIAHQRLTANGLSQCESNLARTMTVAAEQRHFRNSLLSVAQEKTRRHFVPVESWPHSASGSGDVDAVLVTEVEDVRLERTGKRDNSFALRIKARARLMRPTDGSVLLDHLVEYRSSTCLFLDWTRVNSLQQVCDTAYRKLAEQVVEQLIGATAEDPVLVGAGYEKSSVRGDEHGVIPVRNDLSTAVPEVRFVNNPADRAEPIDVYSSAWLARVDWRKPLTRDQAANEAVDDLTWQLDGLYNHPNYIVSAAAIAVAIPWGMWKQGSAVVRGLSPAKLKDADTKLSAAVREKNGFWRKPHDELAAVVARQLASRIYQPVMLVKDGVRTAVHPAFQLAADDPVRHGADKAFNVHLVRAALIGDEGINPSVALCVEAEARWIRTRDGREVYSCPIRYRSEKRKFTEWAAHDAQLFREELRRCYREVGTTMVDQLVSRQLIVPKGKPQSTLARN